MGGCTDGLEAGGSVDPDSSVGEVICFSGEDIGGGGGGGAAGELNPVPKALRAACIATA